MTMMQTSVYSQHLMRQQPVARLSGYCCLWNLPDSRGNVFRAGAFSSVLGGQPNIKLLVNHRDELQLASTADGSLLLTEDGHGLKFECALSGQLGADALLARESGHLARASMHVEGYSDQLAGRPQNQEINRVALLTEISILNDAAQPLTSCSVVGRPHLPTSPSSSLPATAGDQLRLPGVLQRFGLVNRLQPVGPRHLQPAAAPVKPTAVDDDAAEHDAAAAAFFSSPARNAEHERGRRDRLAAMLAPAKRKAAAGQTLTADEKLRMEVVGAEVAELDRWLRAVGAAA